MNINLVYSLVFRVLNIKNAFLKVTKSKYLVVFNGNCSNKGINIVSIALNWVIVNTNVSLSVFSLPQAKVDFINYRAFLSSLCKLILNTNSKPTTCPSLFLRALHKKFDSASQIPTNHSINLICIVGIDDTSWEPLIFIWSWLLFL